MNWFKGFALAACLSAPLPMLVALPVLAETATPTATAGAAKADTAKADEDKDDSKMSETDKRAKAVECSKQADAKKLHGEARKKFRSSCKRGK